MAMLPTLIDLPSDYLTALGRVVVRWSFVERQLMNIVYLLLGVSKKHGRVAVREPRADECMSMIQQLMQLENVKVSSVDLDITSKVLAKLKSTRDTLAHGLWLQEPSGKVLIQVTSGTSRPDPKAPKVSKRVNPHGMEVTPSDLEMLAEQIKQLMLALDIVHREIEAQVPSSKPRSRVLDLPDRHAPDRKNEGQDNQPTPSRE